MFINPAEEQEAFDSNITDEMAPNDVAGLLDKYPNIKYVFCNGGTAEKIFKRHVLPNVKRGIFYMRLPSTSPANASTAGAGKCRCGFR